MQVGSLEQQLELALQELMERSTCRCKIQWRDPHELGCYSEPLKADLAWHAQPYT
jgi:hypothetical protein